MLALKLSTLILVLVNLNFNLAYSMEQDAAAIPLDDFQLIEKPIIIPPKAIVQEKVNSFFIHCIGMKTSATINVDLRNFTLQWNQLPNKNESYFLINFENEKFDIPEVREKITYAKDHSEAEVEVFEQYLTHRRIIAKSNTLVEICLKKMKENNDLLKDIKIKKTLLTPQSYSLKAKFNEKLYPITPSNIIRFPITKLDNEFLRSAGDLLDEEKHFQIFHNAKFEGYTSIESLNSMRYNGAVNFHTKDTPEEIMRKFQSIATQIAPGTYVCTLPPSDTNSDYRFLLVRKLTSLDIVTNPHLLAAAEKVQSDEIASEHRKAKVQKFFLKAATYILPFLFETVKQTCDTGSRAVLNTPMEMKSLDRVLSSLISKMQTKLVAIEKEDRTRFDKIEKSKAAQDEFLRKLILGESQVVDDLVRNTTRVGLRETDLNEDDLDKVDMNEILRQMMMGGARHQEFHPQAHYMPEDRNNF